MRFVQAAFLAMVMVGGFAGLARADYFVWQDPKSGLSLSYPDTWAMVSQRQPDEIFSIIAPSSEGDDAVCRVRVREDKRYLVYPPHLGRDVQTISYNREFWDDYLNEYDNVELYSNQDGGLGRGYGSFAVAGYDGALFSPYASFRPRFISASPTLSIVRRGSKRLKNGSLCSSASSGLSTLRKRMMNCGAGTTVISSPIPAWNSNGRVKTLSCATDCSSFLTQWGDDDA